MAFLPTPTLPTIRRQLALVVLTCALPAALGFGLLISHFYDRERAQIQNDAVLTARALIRSVDQDLNNGIIVALALATSPSLANHDFPSFYAQAKGVLRDDFPGYNFVLSNRNSLQLLNTLHPLGTELPDPTSLEPVRKVFETGKPVISDLFIEGRAPSRPVVAVHVPVWRRDEVQYALTVGFTPERLGNTLAEQRLAPNRYFAILDSQGVIVARSRDQERFLGRKASAVVLDAIKAYPEGIVESVTLEGLPVYTMFSRSPASGWSVAIAVPRRAMLEELLASVAWLSWMVLGLFAAGFGMAWFRGGRISRSVRALSTSAIALGSGEPMPTLRPSFREADETALILHNVERELQDHRHHLVALIDERTSQLQTVNEELIVARDIAQAASHAKGAFVANMSHELRTPMNAVLGMAHLLGATPLAPEQRRYLDMIQVSGKSLLGILNDILDFSKIEAGKVELSPGRFSLDEVLHALSSIMNVSAGDKDLELAIGVDPDVPRALYGDALKLQQVLTNLAGNAIKFTQRGEVTVLVECVARQDDTVTLRFSIRDTGIGIDDEQQARLFSPFTQADSSTTRRFGGTGLGLAICKRLVEILGGTITLRSVPGIGSEFCVTLPLQLADCGAAELEPAPATPVRSASASGPAAGGLRLLVIDDNPTSCDYLCKAIAAWNWHADSASSGEAGLARLHAVQADGLRYDLVLLDWQMPGMGGVATMQAIEALLPGAPLPVVLMVNGLGRDRLMRDSAAASARALLSKPVTASSLFDAVHQALAHHGTSVSEPAPVARPQLQARLLLVEDNPLNQRVAQGILEHAGATVRVVENGLIAVELLRHNADDYDLILMDVQMPVMDGFSATRLIRNELHLTMPILAMSAGVMDAERQECIASGMDDFIGKPLDIEQMFATIVRHL